MTTTQMSKLKSILCPLCNRGKIMIEDENTDNDLLQVVIPTGKRKAMWYIKCPKCKNQVGFSITK